MEDYKKKYEQSLEKVKAYDNALNWMRSVYPTMTDALKEDAEHYFPELKESEDERIRKALIQYIKYNVSVISGWRKEELIAWLEKQKDHEDELEKAYKTADEVQYRKGFEDGVASVKPAEWSEEDEKLLTDAIKYLEIFDAQGIHGNRAVQAINWLKSLKERMKGE